MKGKMKCITNSEDGSLDILGGPAYAAGLWLLGDELVVPMLGLQSGPTAVPPVQHANRLGAHLAYGLATGVATGLLRRLLKQTALHPEFDSYMDALISSVSRRAMASVSSREAIFS